MFYSEVSGAEKYRSKRNKFAVYFINLFDVWREDTVRFGIQLLNSTANVKTQMELRFHPTTITSVQDDLTIGSGDCRRY